MYVNQLFRAKVNCILFHQTLNRLTESVIIIITYLYVDKFILVKNNLNLIGI